MVVEGFPTKQESPSTHAHLLELGFRRFGQTYFRPVCPSCHECRPLRVLVERFRPTKSQRRVLRRNADVEVEVGSPALDDERLALFDRFHAERSQKRGWPPHDFDRESFTDSFLRNAVATFELRYRLDGRLVALAYVDQSSWGLSSMYAVHEPAQSRRGLGTFDVLMEIELARRVRAPYLYLGYLVRDCLSMEYKAAFRPFELLVEGAWEPCETGRPSGARGGGLADAGRAPASGGAP